MNLVNIFLPTLEPLFGLLVHSKSDFFFSYQMLIFCHVPLRRLAKVQAWMCYRYCCFSYLWCFAVCLSIFFLNIASPISCSVFILFVYFFYLFCVISLIYILIFETPLGLKNQWKAKHVYLLFVRFSFLKCLNIFNFVQLQSPKKISCNICI